MFLGVILECLVDGESVVDCIADGFVDRYDDCFEEDDADKISMVVKDFVDTFLPATASVGDMVECVDMEFSVTVEAVFCVTDGTGFSVTDDVDVFR